MDFWQYEKEAVDQGYAAVCGCDEAGAGPLAGPVYAAAVILPFGEDIPGLDDSKKLTEKKREMLFDVITEIAVAYSVQYADAGIIDDINIKNATHLAMGNAVKALQVTPDFLIIDGSDRVPYPIPYEYIIKGDAKSQTIAAASILAKVSRDRLMKELDKQYPQYNFAKHKGYGTQEHMQAIRTYGTCEIHRQSFMTDKVLGK